jgi:hypothetical protein
VLCGGEPFDYSTLLTTQYTRSYSMLKPRHWGCKTQILAGYTAVSPLSSITDHSKYSSLPIS